MPIKTGSGGLKYQLPSQAQLQAQQAAASASAGGSASASAYGANRRLAGDKMQLRYNAYQADMDRAFRAEQAFYGREHEMGAQLESQAFRADLQYKQRLHETDLQNASQKFRGDQAQLDRDFQGEQQRLNRGFQGDQRQLDRDHDNAQFERRVDAQIEQDIASGKLELPPETVAALNKLEAGQADLREFDLDQQEEFKKKYEAEKRRLLRTATTPGGPTATGQFNRKITHVDPNTGKSFDNPIPGRTRPYDTETKGFVDEDQYKEKQQEKIRQDAIRIEQEKTKQKQFDKYEADNNTYKSKVDAKAEKIKKELGDDELTDEHVEKAKRELARSGITEPKMPNEQLPAPGAAPVTQGAAQAAEGNQYPLPPGTMPGAKWVDDKTIQLPDGRLIQPMPADSAPSRGGLLSRGKPSMNDVAKQKAAPAGAPAPITTNIPGWNRGAVPMPSGIPPQPQTAGGTLTPLPEVAPGLQGGASPMPSGAQQGAQSQSMPPVHTMGQGENILNINSPERVKRANEAKLQALPVGQEYQLPDGSIWVRGKGSIYDDYKKTNF